MFQVSGRFPETETSENCFSDVDDTMWSKKYICAAKNQAITSGYEDGSFRPYNTITTLEALAFIGRSFDFQIPNTQNEWFENYRAFFDKNSIFEKHLFTQNTLLSRGQAVELLMRSFQYKNENISENVSSGCEKSQIPRDSGTIEVAGKTRKYILSLPKDYSPGKKYPLIF